MPDGPRVNAPDYDDDFYAWTQHQAAVLRSMPTADNRFDRENVAEEIESLGRDQRDAVRSQVRRVIEHFLKLQYSPAREPRSGWMGSVVEARAALEDRMSATLRSAIEAELSRLYRVGRKQAALGMEPYGETNAAAVLPAVCPYTLAEICRDDWYPEPLEQP
ncbi:MAG TPA: DUF29 domain-containing protein [Stellaceae bacterium]|nr:DUF29 domain-containing protein [Stellaceae bacterium]